MFVPPNAFRQSVFARRDNMMKTKVRRRLRAAARAALAASCEPLESRLLLSSVTSYHNDLASTGQNLTETTLTPANVNSGSFGKLFSTPVVGQVYAQPLYLPGVNITTGASQGTHNVVFIATEHDNLYAIDSGSGTILWQDSFLVADPALTGTVTVSTASSNDVGTGDISPEIGITGTPVIDTASGSLFLVAKTKQVVNGSTTHFIETLFKVNIQDGTNTSTVIGDTIPLGGNNYTYRNNLDPYVVGTGDGAISVGGQSRVYFNALRSPNRPGLTISGGNVYIAFASHGDNNPYHGWILGYNESTLANVAVFNTTPNSYRGGIWSGGDRITIDPQGFMYVMTGNGGFDTSLTAQGFPSGGDYGDSFIKIAVDPSTSATNQNVNGWGLKVVDYFTPFNEANLDGGDTDLGSGGTMILPDTAGSISIGSASAPHLLVGAGKEGRIYLLNRDNMGKFDPSTDHVVQEVDAISGSYDTPSFFYDGTTARIYYAGQGDVGRSFSIANGHISTSPTSTTSDSFGVHGSTASISANGTANGIVWLLDGSSNQLRAYNASNLAQELYTSTQAGGGRDALSGSVVKFTLPTVVDGLVFVGTSNALNVYGLLAPPTNVPADPTNLTATAVSGVQINLSWADNANNEAGYYVEQSNDGGKSFARIATLGVNATSYAATGLLQSTSYSFRVQAFNALGTSHYSNVASATTTNQAPSVDFSSGFAGSSGLLTFNGSTTLNGSRLELTDGGGGEASSAFTDTQVPVQKFSSAFDFQLSNATADGFTFTIQNQGPTALGGTGGSLGYEGIKNSVAVKFDLYDNQGEGTDSTGVFINGHFPGVGGGAPEMSVDMSGSGIDLHSGDVMNVALSYDGTTLHEVVSDATAGASFSQDYPIDIPGTIGSNTAYVGFTAGTGGAAAVQDILDWTFTPIQTAPPAAPSGLTVTPASATELDLSWTSNSTNQNGFKILRSNSQNGTYTQVGSTSPNVTTFADTALTSGATYYYEVVATNTAGDSAPDGPVSGTTPVAPAAPSGLAASNITTSSVKLTWQNNATNATQIVITRQLESDNSQIVVKLPPTATTYTDNAVQAGRAYQYMVVAMNLAGPSMGDTIQTQTLPGAPSGVTAMAGANQVALNWTALGHAVTSYDVYRGTTSGGEGSTPIATGITTSAYTDTNVTAGQTYYYTVTAVDMTGQGAPSSEVSATPLAGAPKLLSTVVNDGSAQRSLVDSLKLTFDHAVTLATGALTLALHSGSSGTVPTLSWSTSDGGLTWVATFSGAGVVNKSIADGRYDLTVHANLISDGSNQKMSGGDQTVTFFRLFGDYDGNGTVNNADFLRFKTTYNKSSPDPAYLALFDYDGNGTVNNADYLQFKKRYLMTV